MKKKWLKRVLCRQWLGRASCNLINGDVVTSMTVDGEKTDVKLQLNMEDISSLDQLGKQEINNVMGMPVALSEIGELKRVSNRNAITHLNDSQGYIMVYGQITDSNTGEVSAKADKAIAKLNLPNTVNYYKEGASAAMEEGFTNLAIAIAVSVLLDCIWSWSLLLEKEKRHLSFCSLSHSP